MKPRHLLATAVLLAECAAQAALPLPAQPLPAAQASDDAAPDDAINPWGLLGLLAALGVGMGTVGLHGRVLARQKAHEEQRAEQHEDPATRPPRHGATLWKP